MYTHIYIYIYIYTHMYMRTRCGPGGLPLLRRLSERRSYHCCIINMIELLSI